MKQVNVRTPGGSRVPGVPSSEIGTGQAPNTDAGGAPDDSFVAPSEASSTPVDGLVIWGTDVSVAVCKSKFKKFGFIFGLFYKTKQVKLYF